MGCPHYAHVQDRELSVRFVWDNLHELAVVGHSVLREKNVKIAVYGTS